MKLPQELWQRDKINDPLICLLEQELLNRLFQSRLAELEVEWFPTIEASSTDLIETYVANGLGLGMSVQVPSRSLPQNVRALALKDFPPARIGALWRGKNTPLLDAFLNVAKQRAKEIA